MQIILSPAKQMKMDTEIQMEYSTPILSNKKDQLIKHLQSLTFDDLKNILNCSQPLAYKAYEQIQNHDNLQSGHAIVSFSGIQYQYMHPSVFTDEQFLFLQNHVWILSGLYGLLRPLDEIKPYRLEMMTKCPFSLYSYWKNDISNHIPEQPILNLASEEYAKCIRKYRPLIDVRFCQNVNGKLKEKGVYVKMARGAMVRYIVENEIDSIEDIKQFKEFNYMYSKEDSTDTCITFVQRAG